MTDHEFDVEVMVRGYHIYQSVWDAAEDGEVLKLLHRSGKYSWSISCSCKKGCCDNRPHSPYYKVYPQWFSFYTSRRNYFMHGEWKQVIFCRFAAGRTRNTLLTDISNK